MNRLIGQTPFYVLVAVILISTLVGCGKSAPPAGSLSGSVYYQDEKVSDCRVSLYNPSTLRTIGGKVGEEGDFLIVDVPVGDYQVSVKQRVTNAVNEEPFDERIPEKYRNGETSGFSISVVEGENSIELKMEK